MTWDKYNRAKEIEDEVDCLNTIENSLNKALIRLSKEHGEKLKEIITDFCKITRNELEEEFNSL
jgi:hypothetical protein